MLDSVFGEILNLQILFLGFFLIYKKKYMELRLRNDIIEIRLLVAISVIYCPLFCLLVCRSTLVFISISFFTCKNKRRTE